MSLEDRIKILMDYLRLKISEHDWHAVADAAMDLREIEAEERARLRCANVVHPSQFK